MSAHVRLSIGTVAWPVVCMLVAGCTEQQSASYMTFTAAQLEGAVHQGWVPAWLPKNAHTLKEHHDPDSKASVLVFSFPASDKWAPPGACLPIEPAQARGPSVKVSWWPPDMPSPADTPDRHTYYACTDAGAFLAVNFSRGDAFYWRP